MKSQILQDPALLALSACAPSVTQKSSILIGLNVGWGQKWAIICVEVEEGWGYCELNLWL